MQITAYNVMFLFSLKLIILSHEILFCFFLDIVGIISAFGLTLPAKSEVIFVIHSFVSLSQCKSDFSTNLF